METIVCNPTEVESKLNYNDTVIFVGRNTFPGQTYFESFGIPAIEAYLDFLVKSKFIEPPIYCEPCAKT